MSDFPEILRRLGWSDDLISTFLRQASFEPAVFDRSFVGLPTVVDTTTIVIDARAALATASAPVVSYSQYDA